MNWREDKYYLLTAVTVSRRVAWSKVHAGVGCNEELRVYTLETRFTPKSFGIVICTFESAWIGFTSEMRTVSVDGSLMEGSFDETSTFELWLTAAALTFNSIYVPVAVSSIISPVLLVVLKLKPVTIEVVGGPRTPLTEKLKAVF